MKLLLAGPPNDTEGGAVTRELVMLAILCRGDPEPAQLTSLSSFGEFGKKGDL